jgi:hypothetical protein
VCGVNWNLAILEGIAIQVLDGMLILSELVQSHTGIAVHLLTGTDTTEKNNRLLRFQESAGTSKFTFRLVRNDGSAQRVAVKPAIANRTHAESDHVDRIATNPKVASASSWNIQPVAIWLQTTYIFFSGKQLFFKALLLGFMV